MEFKINSSDLLKALSHIHGIVEVRHTMPILSNIILKYDMKLQEKKSQFTTKEIVDATNAILDDVEKY